MTEHSIQVDMITAEEASTPLVSTYWDESEHFPTLFPEEMCIELHFQPRNDLPLREYLSIDRTRRALGQVAHYIELRQEVTGFTNVIGVTHNRLAHLAVKYFDFTPVPDIPLDSYYVDTVEYLSEVYASQPNLIYMNSQKFLKTFKAGEPSFDIRLAASLRNLEDQVDTYQMTL